MPPSNTACFLRSFLSWCLEVGSGVTSDPGLESLKGLQTPFSWFFLHFYFVTLPITPEGLRIRAGRRKTALMLPVRKKWQSLDYPCKLSF